MVRALSRIYPEEIITHQGKRWGLSVPRSFLRQRRWLKGRDSNYRPSAVRRPTQKVSLVGFSFTTWSDLSCDHMWSRPEDSLGWGTPLSRGSVCWLRTPASLAPPSRAVCDRGHCTPVGAWWLTPNQSVYRMTAKVRCKRYENMGMKEPVATMLEALVPRVTGTYLFWMATFLCLFPSF